MLVDQRGSIGNFEGREREREKGPEREIILSNFKILRTILSHDLSPAVIPSI